MNKIEKALDYIYGFNREKINLVKAVEILEKEKENNPIALYLLISFSNSPPFHLDYKMDGRTFEQLLELQNDSHAQNCLGGCYSYGYYVPKDEEKAFYWYTRSAEQGNPLGQGKLGYCYMNGKGVAKDYEKASYWYNRSAEKGVAGAQHNLGYLNDEKGPQKNLERAVYWYTLASEQGYHTSQGRLGYFYEKGIAVKQDLERAVYWYTLASEQDNYSAQCSLALCYYNGTGIDKNLERAFYWFNRSANLGYSSSQCNLGHFYFNGFGTEKNFEKAFYWFTRSAEQQNTHAEYDLGYCHEHGFGVTKDMEKAIYWYTLSANKGYAKSKDALFRLNEPIIEISKIQNISSDRNLTNIPPDMFCCVCITNIRNTVCLPCKHMPTCFNCIKELTKKSCPICRREIKQVIKLFL